MHADSVNLELHDHYLEIIHVSDKVVFFKKITVTITKYYRLQFRNTDIAQPGNSQVFQPQVFLANPCSKTPTDQNRGSIGKRRLFAHHTPTLIPYLRVAHPHPPSSPHTPLPPPCWILTYILVIFGTYLLMTTCRSEMEMGWISKKKPGQSSQFKHSVNIKWKFDTTRLLL